MDMEFAASYRNLWRVVYIPSSPPCASLALAISRFILDLIYFANNHSKEFSTSSRNHKQSVETGRIMENILTVCSYYKYVVKAHVRKKKTLHTRKLFYSYQQFEYRCKISLNRKGFPY